MNCIHCLKEIDIKTKDHVFPDSWYPDNTDEKIQRWTVPSCNKCNSELGKIEQTLFLKLALCVDPNKMEASGIAKKALKAYKVDFSQKGTKEAIIREKLLKKTLEELKPYSDGMETFPGFGPHPTSDQQYYVDIPHVDLILVTKKIIRGCEYKIERRLIESPYKLDIFFPKNKVYDVDNFFERKSAISKYHGPGFKFHRIAAREDKKQVLYKVVIWGALNFYAVIKR